MSKCALVRVCAPLERTSAKTLTFRTRVIGSGFPIAACCRPAGTSTVVGIRARSFQRGHAASPLALAPLAGHSAGQLWLGGSPPDHEKIRRTQPVAWLAKKRERSGSSEYGIEMEACGHRAAATSHLSLTLYLIPSDAYAVRPRHYSSINCSRSR